MTSNAVSRYTKFDWLSNDESPFQANQISSNITFSVFDVIMKQVRCKPPILGFLYAVNLNGGQPQLY